MTLPLFDITTPAPQQPPTTRHGAAPDPSAAALHPLGRILGVHLGLHPDAGPPSHSFHIGLRCGTCRWRQLAPEEISGRRYPKCAFDDWARATAGAGSDVLSYWPACTGYQPLEPS